MFFNVGGAEVLVIAIVTLIAVGPEQLPSVLRKFGRMVAQARSMTTNLRDEFMAGLDDVRDVVDPDDWLGTGSDDDPVVPRGYSERRADPDGVSATPGDATAIPAAPTNDEGDEQA